MSSVAPSDQPGTPLMPRDTSRASVPGSQRRLRFRDLRAAAAESGLDLRNTWQIVVGAILLPLGFAAIILGWAGAAHGRVDQQQIPYVISGGLLGLAAVIVGAFLFWAHWLYRIYDQADLHHQAVMRQQADFHRAVLQALGSGTGFAAASANGLVDGGAGAVVAGEYVATPSGTNFHTPECPIVANHTSLRQVSPADAKRMRPCGICEPQGKGQAKGRQAQKSR